MRKIILFFLIVFFTGCHPFSAQVPGKPTQVWTPRPSTPDTSATLAALPSGPTIESSGIVLQAFFDSDDRRDLEGVLAALTDTFAYGDCDFAVRQMFVFETKEELTPWLQAKFAEGDRFHVEEMTIAPTEGSPAYDPRSAAVQVSRTNESLKELIEGKQSLFKIILNTEGNRIRYLNTYGNVDCEAGR